MSAEEQLLETIEEDEEDNEIAGSPAWREKQRRRLGQKNRAAINRFLGKTKHGNHVATFLFPFRENENRSSTPNRLPFSVRGYPPLLTLQAQGEAFCMGFVAA
jgi:hypothetical protein